MAKRKLYIHVGPHKTGSSTIQRGLVLNRNALQIKGFDYPDVAFSFNGQHGLVRDLKGNLDPKVGGLNDLVQYARASNNHMILSSETFDAINSATPLHRLKRAFADLFTIRIIAYLRPQEELLQSLWKTKTQFINLRNNFNEWIPWALKENKFLKYDEWLSVFEQVFGKANLHIKIYDPSTDDLLFQLLKICSISDFSEFKAQDRANISYSGLSFELARKLLEHPFAEHLRNAKDLGSLKTENVLAIITDFLRSERLDTTQSLYSADNLKRVRQHFKPHNQKTARRYFDRAQLFENPQRLKPSRGKLTDQLSPDQILRLCGVLIEMEQARARQEPSKV
ncbi:MAG: hypothetical protein HKN36_02325 [Hellea sp.]|nr:hypothetical protein [Hellea sp.]